MFGWFLTMFCICSAMFLAIKQSCPLHYACQPCPATAALLLLLSCCLQTVVYAVEILLVLMMTMLVATAASPAASHAQAARDLTFVWVQATLDMTPVAQMVSNMAFCIVGAIWCARAGKLNWLQVSAAVLSPEVKHSSHQTSIAFKFTLLKSNQLYLTSFNSI
jgi:hypothetical protein